MDVLKENINPFHLRNYDAFVKKENDIVVFMHVRDTCVVTLNPTSHKIFLNHKKLQRKLVSIEYQQKPVFANGKMFKKNKRKSKKGRNHLKENDDLLKIKYSEVVDGKKIEKEMSVCIGIEGNLIEINESIEKDPNLLLRRPCEHGYLCILQLKEFKSDSFTPINDLVFS